MLFFICLLLIVLIIILQLKVSRLSESKDSSNDENNEGLKAQHVGKGIDVRRSGPQTESTFQKIFLGNIFNKIGAIAIIIALIFL